MKSDLIARIPLTFTRMSYGNAEKSGPIGERDQANYCCLLLHLKIKGRRQTIEGGQIIVLTRMEVALKSADKLKRWRYVIS